MITIGVANFKGGVGKTTTAVFLADALHSSGSKVVIVDADPQGSAMRWHEARDGDGPETFDMPSKTLHKTLPGSNLRADVVIIDSPPLEQEAGIVNSVLRVADIVIIPTAPTPLDVVRLDAMKTALSDIEPLRAQPPRVFILLVKTITNAASTATYRQWCTEQGWKVLDAVIPRREAIAQALIDKIPRINPYVDVAEELASILTAD